MEACYLQEVFAEEAMKNPKKSGRHTCYPGHCEPKKAARITDKEMLNFLIFTYRMDWPRGFGRREIRTAIRASKKQGRRR